MLELTFSEMEVDSDYLNCRTCRVRFSETVTHREHFKSEWHLYNIKRKVEKPRKPSQKSVLGDQIGADKRRRVR